MQEVGENETEVTEFILIGWSSRPSIGVWLGITEGFLLAIMAYDQYIAISAPLHYTITMSKKQCIQLAVGTWSVGLVTLLFTGILTFLGLFTFILFCYLWIVVEIHSTGGRLKAFSIYVSHLTVVSIFYSTAIFSYLRLQAKNMKETDKTTSVFYGILTPMLNPVNYTLRNKEVIGALHKFT
ncbi:Olfactory receptor 13H1, partial [Ophiophagus hannah]